jgi:hypothetical protein
MTRLVQLTHPEKGRRVAVVDGEELRLLGGFESVYGLAHAAIAASKRLADVVRSATATEGLNYGKVHGGETKWRILPAFDHPEEPARCLVSGTGLTHKASAENRAAMHAGPKKEAVITDSMRMFQLGVEGGRPASGQIGVAPEWFYKGCGTILRGHNDPLEVPSFADDGGEEAEVAGIYLVDNSGHPRRVGMALANEFSDHVLERKNYLYLAPSKLRTCAIGPELILEPEFANARGTVRIERKGQPVWSETFFTGDKNMAHTVENLEHHHFKFPAHRRPGDVHIHFFGADVFSFGAGVRLENGDVMQIELSGFGRALRNPIRIDRSPAQRVKVEAI